MGAVFDEHQTISLFSKDLAQVPFFKESRRSVGFSG